MKLGVDLSNCIREVHEIGSTTYVNICEGFTQVSVPWGTGDWIIASFIGALILGLAALVLILVYAMFSNSI